MRPGDWRMTVELIEGGQRKNYAPTVHHYNVTFEVVPYVFHLTEEQKANPPQWVPCLWPREIIERHLRAVYGWVDDADGDWASARLQFITNPSPGVWSFRVEEAYTG